MSVVTLSVLSTATAYLLYFYLLQTAAAANLTMVTLLIPPLAVGLGVTFHAESFSNQILVGFCFIVVGLAMIDGRVFSWNRRSLAND